MDLPKVTRRSFLLASAAFPVGCALSRRGAERGAPSPEVRLPLAGQSWHYIKRDLFNGALIDTQVDQVATVGRTIDIDSHTESDKDEQGSSSGARAWLRKYFDHPRVGVALPSEIQGPWGMVLVDPHWSQVQVYESPIPLWPTRLEPGWQVHIRSKYRTSEDGAGLPWEQTMKAEAWETITVPAGQYKALRYKNSINFENSDVGRTNSVRRETIWLAPEVGRWVARESSGTYYLDDSVIDTPYNEDSYRWELLGWT